MTFFETHCSSAITSQTKRPKVTDIVSYSSSRTVVQLAVNDRDVTRW